ncbi:MAG: DUF2169 domain-containing protein [Rubrivivax sp.]|nr:MAG: DUF2169 domain-containing protein [Rubrivivax sp.]
MQIQVGSKHLAVDTSVALDAQGREYLVVLAKATWSIPGPGQRPRPLLPLPVVSTDDYFGAPGESAMRYGADVARFKPRCDVIFDATAYSAGGVPVTSLLAGWRVGDLSKQVRAVGPRHWTSSLEPGRPAAFSDMPLRYSHAYGGTRSYEDPAPRVETFELNPVGLGFAGPRTLAQMSGQALPTLEAVDDPILRPDGAHRAVAFGPIGRHWVPRRGLSGTYDERWRKEVFPFLPDDFDEAFNQVAPPDQQMPFPRGGEEVTLTRLMPHQEGSAERRFRLPRLDQPAVRVLRQDYSQERLTPVVDTLFFETDAVIEEDSGRRGRLTAVWRVATPIRRRIQEFSVITVGPVDEAWWTAKAMGQADASCVGCAPARTPATSEIGEDDE